jgi:excisionase family DNA binding protein
MVTPMFEQYHDVVTVEELAEMLKIGRNTAYELVRADIIDCVRVGRNIRISKQSVIDYITQKDEKALSFRPLCGIMKSPKNIVWANSVNQKEDTH